MIGRQKRLKEVYEHLRKYYGIHTQTDFAEALKYSRVYISSAMNGNQKNLTDKLFENICEAYKGVFDLEYLLTGNGYLLTDEEESNIDKIRRMCETEPQPATTTLDTSSYLNALLAKTDETIAAMKRELATKDELIAAKDDRITDLTKLAEERLHRIAELRRIIDANSLSIAGYPFTTGVADQPNATP